MLVSEWFAECDYLFAAYFIREAVDSGKMVRGVVDVYIPTTTELRCARIVGISEE